MSAWPVQRAVSRLRTAGLTLAGAGAAALLAHGPAVKIISARATQLTARGIIVQHP
jgi:hypothetical protein